MRVAEYTFRAQIADRWRDRRIFLLGDAAHLTPPFIGQGMGAGLRDATNLAWKLAAVLSGDLPEHLLDTYEAERKPHARAMIRLAKLVGTVMTGGGEFGKLARRLVAPRLHHLPGIRQHVLDSRTPPLRRTALVARSRLGRSLAGQLCPNAAIDGAQRFDDLAAGRFALVTATTPTPAQQRAIARRGAVVITAAPGSDLHRWLRRGRARAALVRPDGTVWRTGRDITALIHCLTPLTRVRGPTGTADPSARAAHGVNGAHYTCHCEGPAMTSENTALPSGGTETTISADTDRPVRPAAAALPATSRGKGVGKGVGKGAAPRRSQQPEPAAAPTGPMARGEHTDTAAALDLLLTDAGRGPLRRLAPAGPGLRWAVDLAGRPTTVVRRVRDLSTELGQVAIGRSAGAAGERDRRFRDDAWRTNPVLRRILQAYLATGGTAEIMLADAHLDWRDRTRLEFALDNLVAALAPSNNPVISPTAWKALIDSGGANVVKGVRNLVTDLVEAPRVPTMVRPDAFEVGADLAVTPGVVVLRTETFELIQYTPQTPTVRTRPLLVVPPVINKYYLADLAPGRSLVEYLVRGGQQVFMISWRNPDGRHRGWGMDVYGQAILDALDAALAVTGADAATVLGFCSGGTLQSMALAALQQRGQLSDKVAGFALAVCVLDQAEAGMGAAALDESTARLATTASATRGYLDGRTLAEIFAWLRPNDLIWNYWVNNYLQGKDPAPFDILFWNADTTRMTAALHREFVDLALRDALVAPGRASMLGQPVDLSAITIDGYVVAGVADHISPWQACYRSAQLFGGQTRFVLSTSGHVAAIVNPPTNAKATHQVSADLGTEPAGWQRATATTAGSWWPDYLAWLSQRSGPDRDAPNALGGAGLVPLDAAPGVYVLDR